MEEDFWYLKEQQQQHRRVPSVESVVVKDRDEELALFQHIRVHERTNFLHHSSDSDESISIKLGSFSSFKFSVSTPKLRNGNDLLNTDIDKNDYNWLMTPPGTPLFPSLDQETPLVNIPQRGTLRSQPIPISRASRTDSSPRTTRSSSSPRRSSPFSSSSSINNYSRGRASTAPSASASPNLHPLTPTARSSARTARSSTPPSRSSTSSFQKSSTGSSGCSSSVGRARHSPAKTIRGSLSSPKLQAWQTNIPGFVTEPPPNLRTTLSDCMLSHTRGSSPSSRHRWETGNGSKRQFASPGARGISSRSDNHDRDPFTSHSKGHIVSSCTDENNSVHSAFPGKKGSNTDVMGGCKLVRKQTCISNRTQLLSKGPARSTSSSSVSAGFVSKRSSDSLGRQMSANQTSRSMFRPLLSNAPATSFYTNKTKRLQCQIINSAESTKSNGSCEHANIASVTKITERDDKDQESERKYNTLPYGQEQTPVSEKMEIKSQDAWSHYSGCGGRLLKEHDFLEQGDIAEVGDWCLDAHVKCDGHDLREITIRDKDSWKHGKLLVDVNLKSMPRVIGDDLSDSCQSIDIQHPQDSYQGPDTFKDSIFSLDSQRQKAALNDSDDIEGSHGTDNFENRPVSSGYQSKEAVSKHNNDLTCSHSMCTQEDSSPTDMSTKKLWDSNWESLGVDLQNSKTENIEKLDSCLGQDIIKQESVEKQDVETCSIQIHGPGDYESRCLQDLSIHQPAIGNEQSFAAHGVVMTSQVDLISEVQGDERSACCLDGGNAQANTAADKSCINSFSNVLERRCSVKFGISEHAAAATEGPTNAHQDGNAGIYLGKGSILSLQENCVGSEMNMKKNNSIALELVGRMDMRMNKSLAREMGGQETNYFSIEVSNLEAQDERCSHSKSCELSENFGYSCFEQKKYNALTQTSVGSPEQEKECKVTNRDTVKITADHSMQASVNFIVSTEHTSTQEMEVGGEKCECEMNSQTEAVLSTIIPSNLEINTEPFASARLEGDDQSNDLETKHLSPECDKAEQGYVSQGESGANADAPRGYLSRSMTLEEATDTVLFCSSIVHSLVYKAATIAMEKENLVVTPIPTVTILERPQAQRRNVCRAAAARRTLTYQTINSRQTVAQLHTPSNRIETTIKDQQPVMHVTFGEMNESPKPKKVNSKCRCTVL